MIKERAIIAYKKYFSDFIKSIDTDAVKKIFYVLDMLKTHQFVSAKFIKKIKDEVYEIRAEYNGNIYRVFFIFDDGNIVVLFNGFQKKTQKTPQKEIKKALMIKNEYYAAKRNR